MSHWAQENTVEPIQVFAVSVATGAPLTGATDLFVRLRRVSDGFYFDWSDSTFKSSGFTTLNQTLTEQDATNAAGLYAVTGGFDLSAVTNKAVSDTYVVIPLQTPGTSAILPTPDDFREGQILESIGTGARQVTIHVEDTSAVDLSGVQVDIFDSTNTTLLLRVFTDIAGDVTVAIDDGAYAVRLFKSLHTFTVPETLTVTMNQTTTFVGTPVTIPIPSAPNLCVIFGTLVNAGGEDLVGANVRAFAVVDPTQAVGGLQLADPIAETTTDQDGFFQLELIRLSLVLFIIEEAGIEFIRTVPDLTSQDLTTWPP